MQQQPEVRSQKPECTLHMQKEQIDELSAIQLNLEKCVPFFFPFF